jgi:hypothetical protein
MPFQVDTLSIIQAYGPKADGTAFQALAELDNDLNGYALTMMQLPSGRPGEIWFLA